MIKPRYSVYYTTIRNGEELQPPLYDFTLHTQTNSEKMAFLAEEEAAGMLGPGLVAMVIMDGELRHVLGGTK